MSNGQQQLELVMERLEQVRAAYLESARFAAESCIMVARKK
tara:strand:+ start:590 stop:712 length:123 start_codon:yes stop_codon:yes gene_type:complete